MSNDFDESLHKALDFIIGELQIFVSRMFHYCLGKQQNAMEQITLLFFLNHLQPLIRKKDGKSEQNIIKKGTRSK